MTTYRKDAKKENHILLSTTDSHNYYQNEVLDYLQALHSRVNCLIGFTVISLLIGSAALVISILLLLQAFDTMGQENAKLETLEMRIKSLEHLTKIMKPTQKSIDNPNDVQTAPPTPPQTPPPTPTPPPPPPPPPPPRRPQETGTQSPLPTPHSLRPLARASQNDREMKLEIAPWGSSGGGDNTGANIGDRRRPLPPIDDEQDSDGDTEGSGDDCPINPPRPICPVGMRLCTTKERCPKYVCCRH